MASVDKRMRNGHTTWVARWRDPDGRQRKRSFTRKSDADRFLTGTEHSNLVGSYVDPAAGRITVREMAEAWRATRAHLQPKTVASYDSALRSRVLPRWGAVPVSRVTYENVAAWVAAMQTEGLSAARCRYVFGVLRMVLDDAVKAGRLARNPAGDVDNLPKLPTTERRYLSHEQVAALADAAGAYRSLVLTLAYTGLRWGEAAALRVGQVDLMRRRLEVAEAMTEVSGRALFGPPKTYAHRSAPVPRFLCGDLAVQLAGKSPDDLVFVSPAGAVLRVGNWRRQCFDRAVREAGLDLTPHAARHTAASLAIASGASVKSVQRMLGHKSADLTLDLYGHLYEDDLDAVADRLHEARVPQVRPGRTVTPLTHRETGS